MKNRYWLLVIALLAAPLIVLAQDTLPQGGRPAPLPKADDPVLTQKVSYSFGRSIAEQCKVAGMKLDIQAFSTAVADVMADANPKFSDEDLDEARRMFGQILFQKIAEKNKKEGAAFLAANAKKQGVQTTASGLQYQVLRNGEGPTPKPTDVVICHYRGSFITGEVFESSYESGQPATFPVNRVIPGWTEALQMMKVGQKVKLFIPSDLAYGPQGNQGIGPNSTLIFEIELLRIAPAGGLGLPPQ